MESNIMECDSINLDPNNNKFEHIIRLNKERERIIPEGHNIASITFDGVRSACITEVHILIGGQSVLKVPCEFVEPGKNILDTVLAKPEDGLPISLSRYMYTDIMFKFSKDMLIKQSKSYEVDEEIDEETYSDHEYDVYVDAHDAIYRGRRVHYNTVKTGHKIVKYDVVTVHLPKITINTTQCLLDHQTQDDCLMLDVWEYIDVNPMLTHMELFDRFIQQHCLKLTDGSDAYKAFEKGEPFKAILKNQLRFQGYMCGKCFTLAF